MATLTVVLILVVVAAIWGAFKIARMVQRAVDQAQRSDPEAARKVESSFGWLGHIHAAWGALGAAAAAFKFIYRAWKTAPAGSWEKLGWGCLLAGIIAAAMWIIVKMVDAKLNPPVKYGEDTPSSASLASAASQTGATEDS